MYELVDPRAESILVADAARGVHVRVILDRRLERVRNQAAFSYLSAAASTFGGHRTSWTHST
jgi:hypothetical protein